ncbi:hypothetical protein [Aeromicrobium halocynthiae]
MNDFDNYADLYGGVTAAQIRAAAEEPAANARIITDIAADLGTDADAVTASTEGDITAGTRTNAQTVQQSAVALSQAGEYGVAALHEFAAHVEAFDTSVAELNQRLRTNVASAQRLAGQAAAENDEDPPEYAETWAAIRASLVPEYNRAVSTLDDNAEATASRFEQGPTLANVKDLVLAGLIPYTIASSTWPNLTLTADERRQALENEVANMTPAEQVAWVRANADVDPAIADVISPEAQEILAGDVADDIADPRSIDADTVRLLDLFKEQEAFAHALYSNVTPAQMGDAIAYLNAHAFPDQSYSYGLSENREEQQQLYRDFLTGAGVTMATFTKGTGAYAPPSDLVDTWFDAITRTEYIDHTTSSPVNPDAAALTLLLRAGGQSAEYDTNFIAGLTDRIYDWERAQDGPVWEPRNQPPVYDPFGEGVFANHHDDGSVTFSGSPGGDGLANLLGAMASSPDAARQFFYDGSNDDNGHIDSDKLDYLLGTKDGEGVNARTFSERRGSDEGEGLGLALEAAAVRDGDRPDTHRWSSDFASDVFNRVADLSGHGDRNRFDDAWHIWPSTADNLGNIAASYAPDVYDIINADGQRPQDLNVSRENLLTVVGEVGRGPDKSGVETLSAAVMIEGNHRLAMTISAADPSTLDRLILGRTGTNGEVLGTIINHAITVDQDDMNIAEARAAIAAKALDIAGGFIPGAGSVLGEGASQLAQSAYSTATSQGLSALKDSVSASPDAIGPEWKSDQRVSSEAAIRYHTTNQLIASGIVDVPRSITIPGPEGTRILNPQLYDLDGIDAFEPTSEYTVDQIFAGWDQWTSAPEGETAPVEHTSAYVDAAKDGLDRTLNKSPEND